MSRLRKLHLAVFLVCLVLFGTMAWLTGFPILDTEWLIDSEGVYRILGGLSEEQLRSYEIMLMVDFGYAVAYPALFALTFQYYAVERLGSRRLFFALLPLPVLAGLFDLAENTSILAIMSALPEALPVADRLGLFTSIKWVMVFASLFAALLLPAFVHSRRLFRT